MKQTDLFISFLPYILTNDARAMPEGISLPALPLSVIAADRLNQRMKSFPTMSSTTTI